MTDSTVAGITQRESRALDLLGLLEKAGTTGMTRAEAIAQLGWTNAEFDRHLAYARDAICPTINVTIPHPVPTDGWKYRVTGQWLHHDGTAAIHAGTAYAMGVIEARLASVLRDVRIAKRNVPSNSIVGRRCNFLEKHLTHVVSTLGEIVEPHPQAVAS